MHNFDVKYQSFIYAIMTNKELTDDERSKIIAEFMNDFSNKYPDLGDTATKKDLSETELRLIKEIKEVEINGQKEREEIKLAIKDLESNTQKEIEKVRLEIKEVESNAQKEREEIKLAIKDLESNTQKEIDKVKLEIEKTHIKIETIKSDTLKWMFVMMIGQIFAISGIIIAIFKVFGK